MKKISYVLLLFLFATAAFFAGAWHSTPKTHAQKVLYYVDPMHPAYRSDKPGIAPDCGMKLVAVYAGERTTETAVSAGAVNIDPARQQLFGVRVAPVEKASGSYALRLLGRVVPDEARVYKLNAGIEGYIQEVSPATTGSFVRKDQELATFAAPMAAMTIQTYLLNLGAEDRFKKSAAEGSVEGQSLASANANLQQRTQQLQNLGMSSLQMEEIRRTRRYPDSIRIVSPVDGFVVARNVSPGQKFERDSEWYRIADLRRVWVVTDVFASDAEYLQPGRQVRVRLPNQNKTFMGRVESTLPQLDGSARTLKVRIEVENQGYMLRPDMFVDVELPIAYSRAMVVPSSAVLDSGLKQTVFVERGEGLFSPRTVETGRRFDDRVEIVKGLEAGERIVVTGNFLVSSESRLQEAVENLNGAQPPGPPSRAGVARDGVEVPSAAGTNPSRAKTNLTNSSTNTDSQTATAAPHGRRRG